MTAATSTDASTQLESSEPGPSEPGPSEPGPLTSTKRSVADQPKEEDQLLGKYMDGLFDDDSADEDVDLQDDVQAAILAIRNYNEKKSLDIDVIQYWYNKRFSDPTLSKLALIVHAVPATEVSCERCFSTLKFILNDYRTNIRSDTLADLMLIKLNAI